jgi:hypothetical protein
MQKSKGTFPLMLKARSFGETGRQDSSNTVVTIKCNWKGEVLSFDASSIVTNAGFKGTFKLASKRRC